MAAAVAHCYALEVVVVVVAVERADHVAPSMHFLSQLSERAANVVWSSY